MALLGDMGDLGTRFSLLPWERSACPLLRALSRLSWPVLPETPPGGPCELAGAEPAAWCGVRALGSLTCLPAPCPGLSEDRGAVQGAQDTESAGQAWAR